MRQAHANVSRVPPLSPLIAVALLAIAGVAASVLPRPAWVVRALQAVGTATPLGWYLLGVVLGPALGLPDRSCSTHARRRWPAPSAGSRLARAQARHAACPGDRTAARDTATAGVALVIPRRCSTRPAGTSPRRWRRLEAGRPRDATLAAAVTLAGSADSRRALIVALFAADAGLVVQPPFGRLAGVPFPAAWAGFTIAGVALAALLADRIARRAASPVPGAIAGICLGAGIGLATGASPLLVCALAGAALARWSPPFARLSDDLAVTEPAVAAVLWVAAGASISGPFPAVAVAALLLALWPLLRARLARGALRADPAFGLAVASSFAYTAGPAAGRWGPAIVTATAIGLLVLRTVPAARQLTPSRLTSDARHAEVSV
jgi:hypothetical protein